MGLFFLFPLLVLVALCGSFIYFRRLKKQARRQAHETPSSTVNSSYREFPRSKSAMRGVLKKILFFVLNLFLIFVLAGLVLVYVYIYKGEDPIVLLVTIPADIAFVIIGVLLIVLGRFLRISVLNQALPFIALAYASAMYFIVAFTLENRVILLIATVIGVLLGVLLGVWTTFTAARNLAKVEPGRKG